MAVDEFLRFDSPVNVSTVRFTNAPIQVADTEIPAGEFVMISLLSANHDASQFSEPDSLDISRKGNAHLAFGHEIHYCVGAPLARLEGQIALDRLLARFDLHIDGGSPLEYRDSTIVHGLEALPVTLTRRNSRGQGRCPTSARLPGRRTSRAAPPASSPRFARDEHARHRWDR